MASALGRARVPLAFAAAALLYLLSWHLGEDLRVVRAAVPPHEERLFVPSSQAARFISVGYNELLADVVWARTLVYYGDGMMNNFSMQDVEPMLALVNALDPWFRRPYLWGAYATTFRQKQASQEEFRASIDILERGAKVFPEDWELAWMLGLRYFADLRSDDPVEKRQFEEIGASYIERAMRLPGAPEDLPGLAASLRSRLGQHERALRELGEMILTMPAGKPRDKLIERYQQMSSESQGHAIRQATLDFDARWHKELPFAPPALYVLVGSPPPPRSPEQLLEIPTFLGNAEGGEPPAEAGEPPAEGPAGDAGVLR